MYNSIYWTETSIIKVDNLFHRRLSGKTNIKEEKKYPISVFRNIFIRSLSVYFALICIYDRFFFFLGNTTSYWCGSFFRTLSNDGE